MDTEVIKQGLIQRPQAVTTKGMLVQTTPSRGVGDGLAPPRP
jgi:hypothetical protein